MIKKKLIKNADKVDKFLIKYLKNQKNLKFNKQMEVIMMIAVGFFIGLTLSNFVYQLFTKKKWGDAIIISFFQACALLAFLIANLISKAF